MWIQRDLIAQVEDVVTIRYVNMADCALWNEHRREGEMRLFTGWSWTARHGGEHQQGLKTYSAAVRDAYYRVVLKAELPTKRRHLRVAA